MRKGDTVARLGGDEFVVFLPDIKDRDDAGLVAAKIIGSLGQPYPLGPHLARSSPSLGIAVSPEDGQDLDSLMKRADEAHVPGQAGGAEPLRIRLKETLPAAGLERVDQGRERKDVP